MRVLITGNMGYVGPVLVRLLKKTIPEAQIIGFDAGFFGHSLTGPENLPESLLERQVFGDVRDFPAELLEGVDAVVHLAAVSNDPMGNQFEKVTEEINRDSSVRIATLAAAAGVKNFVFASSCSMYGFAEGDARRETDPTNPLTAYARSKIGTENSLKQLDLGEMVVTCLRFATACGASDRIRLDLVLNDFVAGALTSGKITVLSDGTPWRPMIDVEDMARAILWGISREAGNGGRFLAVNAGSDQNNYQVRDMAEAVARKVSGTEISINTNAPSDNRSYRVDFSLFKSLAPDHLPQVSLDESIERLLATFERMKFNEPDFRNSQYVRLKTLQKHIDSGKLDRELRWRA
ncbi:NAD-dependent epimerase/dehydratase family protein [Gellertiella hungarica]|uniref:Nucleoside-diphosphate-sugar epimerase n=1 Tax=Gellertiella hungarica TaxID=1572859 RepID=A0A7W6NK26_9HYPH|nr:SDR family oxidoreductase [Gellertiella hungarica]MBB4063940.1 nucleoside-diphosphate-sugar epimerase [Gellertiella hungarica]